MNSPKIMDELWQTYLAILPASASSTQIIETRRAFYAGAQALFHKVLLGLSDGPECEEPDLALLDGIHAELNEFCLLIKRGLA